jgi:transposase-like protein
MSTQIRLGIGSRLRHDGELVEIAELHGGVVVLRDSRGRVTSARVVDLLSQPERTQVISDRPADADVSGEPAGVVLSQLDDMTRGRVLERTGHVREVLTGYRSGSPELALPGEPRDGYGPGVGLMRRYELKAAELGVSQVAVRKWVAAFRQSGEAGLAPRTATATRDPLAGVDLRWLDACRAVIDEQVNASTVTKALVLQRVQARLERDFGPGVVAVPSRSKGYALLTELSRGRTRSPAARKAGVRSRTGRLASTAGCGRPGPGSIWCWTPRRWTCSAWSR